MRQNIGIMGPGASATEEQLRIAFQIGQVVANKGFVLLSGGMGGTMEEACRGAHEAGGLVVGICPTNNVEDMCPYIDIAIVTGMGIARNAINILSSDLVVAICAASPGTLAETADAIQLNRPLLIVGGTPEMQAYIPQLEPSGTTVRFTSTIDGVREFLS